MTAIRQSIVIPAEEAALSAGEDGLRHLLGRRGYPLANRLAVLGADLAVFLAAFTQLREGSIDGKIVVLKAGAVPLETGLDWFLVVAAACLLHCYFTGHYSQRRLFWDELRDVLRVVAIAGLADVALLSMVGHPAPVPAVVAGWLFVAAALPLARLATKLLLIRVGWWQQPAIIVGTGDNARQTYAALRRNALLGYDVRLFVRVAPASRREPDQIEVAGQAIPVVYGGLGFAALRERLGMPHVIVAVDEGELVAARAVIDRLSLNPSVLDIVPPVRGLPLYGLDLQSLFAEDLVLLRARNKLAPRGPRLLKRSLDVVAAGLLLALLAPFFLVVAALVRRDGGPAFFGHARVGRDGRLFDCYKFRTMVPEASQVLADLLERDPAARAEWEKDFKLRHDPRITRVGAFLRATSLDELPQLFNVLKGEMSLVGPRPVVTAELERYGQNVAYYLQCRPGLTGLWQISGRNDVDYAYRVFLDVWYVKNWSLWHDIVILLRTLPAVLRRQGAY